MTRPTFTKISSGFLYGNCGRYFKIHGCWKVLSPTRKETSYNDRRFWVPYILFI